MYPQQSSASRLLGIRMSLPAPSRPRSSSWHALTSSRALSIARALSGAAASASSAARGNNRCLIPRANGCDLPTVPECASELIEPRRIVDQDRLPRRRVRCPDWQLVEETPIVDLE